ncbi:MAG: IS110 family transposase [Neisseriaceae bacterium]|jgi:transposase
MLDTRSMLVKQKTMLKNQIHGVFVQNGLKLKASLLCSKKGLASIKSNNMPYTAQINLQILVDMITSINNEMELLDKYLEQEGSKLPGYIHLTQIKGLGFITSIMLLVAIGDINNFNSSKKLAAYFGIVPRVRNSNQTINHGGITKRGDSKVRSNLVQCALVTIKYNGIFKNFYNGLKVSKGHGKAIIATARKLLELVFYTLKHSWYFTDFVANEKEIRVINWNSCY